MQRIAANEFDLGKAGGKMIGQLRIKFDRDYVFGPFQQKFRQRAFARTNFGNYGFILGAGGNCDAPKNGLIGEKVLA